MLHVLGFFVLGLAIVVGLVVTIPWAGNRYRIRLILTAIYGGFIWGYEYFVDGYVFAAFVALVLLIPAGPPFEHLVPVHIFCLLLLAILHSYHLAYEQVKRGKGERHDRAGEFRFHFDHRVKRLPER